MSRSGMTLALAIVATAACSGAAHTLRVPGDWPTIQAGIDAASPGDTVLVAAGTYTGVGNRDIDFGGRAIVLLSESGPEQTTIDCQWVSRALYFATGEDTLSVVSGFTITRGQAALGAGLLCDGTSPKLADMVFVNNRAETEYGGTSAGGGAACLQGAPLFLRCVFRLNSAYCYPGPRGAGGGIYGDSSSPTIRGCLFEQNGAMYGDAISCSGGSPLVVDSTFQTQNEAALFVDSAATLLRCLFQRNRGIPLSLEGPALVQDCVFRDNTNMVCGTGGIDMQFANPGPTVIGCTFIGNVAGPSSGGGTGGGALYCGAPYAQVSWCDFIGNVAPEGGAAYCYNFRGTFSHCTFYGNRADYGAAVCAVFGSRPLICNSIVAFNEGGPAIDVYSTWSPPSATLACSDIYGNPGGDWVGVIANQLGQSGNICLDPLFCDMLPPLDLSLGMGSPCAPGAQPGCGLIGAHDVGCPTAIRGRSWGAIKAMFR